jgi:hypothetical protein
MNATRTHRPAAPPIIIHHSAFIIPSPPLFRQKANNCTPQFLQFPTSPFKLHPSNFSPPLVSS